MKLETFFDAVEEDPDLEGVAIDRAAGKIAVKHLPTRLGTVIDIETLIDIPEEELDNVLEILRVNREPTVLFCMTRVVGYYSRTDNWNPSKVGELKDRRAGDYALST